MAVEHLVKGELDWHNKINDNFDSLDTAIEEANENAGKAVSTKLDKPVDQQMTEGYVYQDPDGSTRLVDGGEEAGKFHYTIIIDNGEDGNPEAITYADDCDGFVEARGSNLGDWANTKLVREYFRPCVIRPGDGAPAYYLQQNDMTKKEDGTAAILTGADGDVMIEVKKLYGKITNVGTRAKIEVANYALDGGFCFTDVGGVEKDVVYRGAYEAGVVSGASTVMRSVSGVAPIVNATRAVMRGYATNRGAGYHQNNVYMIFLWQIMFLLLYKTRNSQTALGQGRTLSTNTAAVNTGTLNSKPFCWGDQGGVNGVKFLGVENFYGNVWEWADGAVLNAKVYKLTRYPSKYNDTGDGYEVSVASGMTKASNSDKYITQMMMTNDIPLLPKASGGSSSTFWCDNMWMDDNVQVVRFGGYWTDAARAGAFCWYLMSAASYSYASIGSRLCRA